MQSDTIWYSSQGLPKNIIDQAKQNLSKLFSGQESSENFEKANKSWYMTAALAAAGLAFIILLIINIATNDDDTEIGVEAPGGELVIESLETGDEQNSYTSSEQPETTVLSKDNLGSSGPDQLSDSRNNTEQFGNEFRTVENSASSTSDMTISANGGEQHTDKSKPDNQPSLSQAEVDEAAESSDPIESIALKVARKDVVATAEPRQNEDFNSWLARHSQDAYSMQLFSHSEKAAAERFQKSLDLADSYVYQANLDGKIRYRVLWGAFDTRAEAQQAIESLPEDILAQQPWIRQFSAIAKEVSQ
ncbi:MAG: hypothetical protein CMP47_04575 [Rickettsiales bacterium]|nr:hypothetical protein [Rickettsiales bacterium]